MSSFDNAEADYLNSYKDLKDRRDHEHELRAIKHFNYLRSQPNEVNDALIDACCNDMFIVLLLRAKGQPQKTYDVLWTFIDTYLKNIADELADDADA